MSHVVIPAVGVALRELLPGAQFFGGQNIHVQACCSDSRRCQPGDLFAALVGADQDGHDFASDAIDRGAAALLAERLLPVRVPQCIVQDTRQSYGRVCHAVAGDPSRHLQVVGVAGTHGKTVTSLLVAAVLEAAGTRTGVRNSLGQRDAADGSNVTHAAADLAHWLARTRLDGCTSAVVEASSQALAQWRLAGTQLDTAILTNLRRAEVEDHGSLWNYRSIQARLFDHLRPGGFIVLNADDAASGKLAAGLDHPVITIGLKSQAELTATLLERHCGEQTFLLEAGSAAVPVRTRIIGDAHIYNCLCAAAVGLVYGIELPTIVRGLEAVDRVPGRMERIECGQEAAVFVDAAHHPDTLATALRTLRSVTDRRLICVFGASDLAGKELRPQLGRTAERLADLAVITSDHPGQDQPLRIAHDILDGFDRPAKAHLLPNRARAIGWALGQARRGDVVLVAGRPAAASQSRDGQTWVFDDREVVRYWLNQQANDRCRPSAAA